MIAHRLIFVAALCIALSSKAQTAKSEAAEVAPALVRTVARVLPADSVVNNGSAAHSTLAEVLIQAACAGKLQAYYNSPPFTDSMPAKSVYELIHRVAIQDVIDPETGKTIKKEINHDVNGREMTSFKVIEQWIYDRWNGTTNVNTVFIGPMRDIWGENGQYRGRHAICFFKYNEVLPYLLQFEQDNPSSSLLKKIWTDYTE